MLLNFYDASVQDGVLLAEVSLYSTFLAVCGKAPQIDADHDCDGFAGWRDEWRHLLGMRGLSFLSMFSLRSMT